MDDPSNLLKNLVLVEENFKWLNKNLKSTIPLRTDESFKYNLNDSFQQKYLLEHYRYYTNRMFTKKWAKPAIQENKCSWAFFDDFCDYNNSILYNYLHVKSNLSTILEKPSIMSISRYEKAEYKNLRDQITLNLESIQLIKEK